MSEMANYTDIFENLCYENNDHNFERAFFQALVNEGSHMRVSSDIDIYIYLLLDIYILMNVIYFISYEYLYTNLFLNIIHNIIVYIIDIKCRKASIYL